MGLDNGGNSARREGDAKTMLKLSQTKLRTGVDEFSSNLPVNGDTLSVTDFDVVW